MNDTYDAVFDHLLFHKALISEDDGGERISGYMRMLQEIEQGQHVTLRDPLEKSIAAAFELVLEKQMNPWDINLAEFTKMYMEKVKDDGYVNFVTAGKLVFMAWSILKMQSDEVLTAAEMPREEEFLFADWDLNLGMYEEPKDLDFTQAVIGGAARPLNEAIRRGGKRAITLMELMDAFDEARDEAERHLQIVTAREQAAKVKIVLPKGNIHTDDLFEDLSSTWTRILEFNGSPISLGDLSNGDVWDKVTVFTSILFLAKLQKIKIWQKKFPYGEIFVQRVDDGTVLTAEELSGFAKSDSKAQVKAAVS